MPSDRHITWENFRRNFIEPGDPATHNVPGRPRAQIFVESDGRRVGARVESDDVAHPVELPYQHIQVQFVRSGGQLWTEISCAVQSLYEPFYAMITAILDLVQNDNYTPVNALDVSANRYFSLLSELSLLSEEKQVGLWCELWVLARLVQFRGPGMVRSWIGPVDEPHDFRYDGVELEVKGTRSRIRSHLISSEYQLAPTLDRSLYVVSIQLAAGEGCGAHSLSDRVGEVERMLVGMFDEQRVFTELLASSGLDRFMMRRCKQKYALRTRPAIVPITPDFPRITSETLGMVLGREKSKRLSDVQYRLDMSDLGFDERTPEFQSILRTE